MKKYTYRRTLSTIISYDKEAGVGVQLKFLKNGERQIVSVTKTLKDGTLGNIPQRLEEAVPGILRYIRENHREDFLEYTQGDLLEDTLGKVTK